MTWQISSNLIPLLLAAAISAALAISAWRGRASTGPVATSFTALMAAAALWALLYALELSVTNPAYRLTYAKLRYVSIASVPVLWLVFAAAYTRKDRWITRRSLAALAVVPALTILIMGSTERHGLHWALPITWTHVSSLYISSSALGPWFYVHSVYSYAMMIGGFLLILNAYRRSPRTYRRHLFALALAVVTPWVGNFLIVSGVTLIDLTPFAFSITGLIVGWGVLRLHLLGVIPIARDVVMESMSDGVLVLDAQSHIVDLNPTAESFFGAAKPQLLGKPVSDILPNVSDVGTFSQPRLEISLRTGGDMDRKTETGAPSAYRDLELRISRLLGKRNALTGIVIILHDFTERREAERRIQAQNEALAKANVELDRARREAEEATRLKSQFLATMSHELRTPLNAVIGYTEIQLAGMTGPLTAEQTDYQQRVLSNADHLLNLINEVLDLSKIEAGRMELQNKPVTLRDWLDESTQHVRGLAESKGLQLVSSLDDGLPATIQGDPGRLKQIAINLLSNAIKFTETGEVRIQVAKHARDAWRVEVSDTGPGIPSHLLETIFQEFRQVDGTTTRQYGGTGLGLAIVRRLALLMGGTVRVKSQMGKGSTFTVFLPLVESGQIENLAQAALTER